MRVCGFSFVKNAIKYDYPIVEAIRSVLPLCDEFVVAVGQSEDDTLELIKSIDPQKIRIVETVWDEEGRKDGSVLSHETNKAMQHIGAGFDWLFYIQGDEVIHEKYHQAIYRSMSTHQHDRDVDGLLLRYLHFYGSYDYVGASSIWYNYEIRIIRQGNGIYSYRDAQGFRKGNDKKLQVVLIDAFVYHYGWVREPQKMHQKQERFDSYYTNDGNYTEKSKEDVPVQAYFDYEKHVTELSPFQGTHPAVMQDRIQRKNWQFEYDISRNTPSLKDRFKRFCLRYLGWNLFYTNYRLIKK